MRRTIVLGPQRRPVLDQVLASLALPDGPVATVTAGWQERESDDAELDTQVGGRGVNLALHARWLAVLDRDPGLAVAQRAHQALVDELAQLYLIQLDAAVGAVGEIVRQGTPGPAHDAVLDDAVAAVRLVDARHLARVAEARAELAGRCAGHEEVARHRAEVAAVLDGAVALAVAGGHVGVLAHVLRLFAVTPPPVLVAWSAGAMACTDRIVLVHDNAPHGPAHPELADAGLGLVAGCVLLPHPRRRLRLDDPARMGLLARRAAPARCVLLDDGVRVDVGPAGALPAGTRVVTVDGAVHAL